MSSYVPLPPIYDPPTRITPRKITRSLTAVDKNSTIETKAMLQQKHEYYSAKARVERSRLVTKNYEMKEKLREKERREREYFQKKLRKYERQMKAKAKVKMENSPFSVDQAAEYEKKRAVEEGKMKMKKRAQSAKRIGRKTSYFTPVDSSVIGFPGYIDFIEPTELRYSSAPENSRMMSGEIQQESNVSVHRLNGSLSKIYFEDKPDLSTTGTYKGTTITATTLTRPMYIPDHTLRVPRPPPSKPPLSSRDGKRIELRWQQQALKRVRSAGVRRVDGPERVKALVWGEASEESGL